MSEKGDAGSRALAVLEVGPRPRRRRTTRGLHPALLPEASKRAERCGAPQFHPTVARKMTVFNKFFTSRDVAKGFSMEICAFLEKI